MSHIIESQVTGDDVSVIVEKLSKVLEGETESNAVVALLSLTLIYMHPDISIEQLQEGVKETSRYLCLLLDHMNAKPLEKGDVN